MTPSIHLALARVTQDIRRDEMACGVRLYNTQYSPPRLRALVFTYHPRHVTCKTCRKRLQLARGLMPR